ncbi:HAD family hydrolase [Candidatus Stoquefichus massiliensis]|uniref:HAD family hydrolase n=1 Tax=Candidatus Stoquefichus massiliensis TaxID=1470350 RepID=UPI0004AF1C86|nr:HAD family phosphatase [Candidatus Stoquefichus massiliensis]
MKGYIFDLDGTLLDSMHIWDVLSIHYLESLKITPQEKLVEQLKALSLYEAAIFIQKEYHLNQSVSQIQDGFYQQLEKEYQTVTLKEGALSFLEKCYQQNIPMCLLTANHSHITHKVLKRLNIYHYFNSIISCDNIQYTKQDIRSYQYASKSLNLPISKCIVVEDALHAIKTAKKSGAFVKAIYDKANHTDWQEIMKIADQTYQSFNHMEV